MEDYNKHFNTPGSQNWLKESVAVNITKRGLAPFACKVCDDIRVEKLKTALNRVVPDLCENCSIVEVIPCDPNNNICNAGQCRFHKGRVFRPCLIIKCNEYRYTVTENIRKGIDLGFTCNSCSTKEIVQCILGNRVCNSGRCKFHMDQNTKLFIQNRPCPSNICDTLRDAIEQKHRFGFPSWKNTDARKWCVNAWDIAKCFMPPDGYADVDNEDDTDLNGIISVYINCEEFQQYFTADLSSRQSICDKVRDVGKHIRHAPGLDVTDDDLKVRLTDLKTLFADPTFNKENPLAQDGLDQLNQLEKDELVIRPSDIKAALDLKATVVELRSGLKKKASALVDVLDCKTDEGVNAIQDATDRAIQDITGLSEDKQASFKSDLNKILIKYHRENNSTLTLGHFLETVDGLDNFYIPPNISKVIPQSMQTYETSKEHTTEPLTSLEQLFSSKGIIILTADAGVGKTSFCKFLVASWCKVQKRSADLKPTVSGTPTVLSDIEYLKEFIYLFYIDLRGNQCDKLEDIIFSHTESVYTKLTRGNNSFDEILSKENGLFILDGLDECNVPSIMPLAANRNYTILITSRPWKLANINICSKYTHAQIEAMQQDVSKELVIRANEFLNKHFKTSYETSAFVHAVQIQHVESHLQNPMFALQLLCVYHNKRSENKTYPKNEAMGSTEYKTESDYHKQELTNLGKTRSHLYANMIELLLRSAEKKDKSLVQGLSELYKNDGQTHALPECFDERNYTCCGLAKLLHGIGKLAASSFLDDNRSSIEEHQIRKLRKEETTVLLKSGLLSNTSLKTISEERSLYTFLHQTYKEMLACVFLSSQDFDSDVWKKFIKKFETVMSPDMLSFLCVMNYEQGCKCLDIFNEKERLFYSDSMFYISELIDYQSTITLAHKECSDNGVKTPRISLKHVLLEQDSGIGPYHALLKASGIKLETIVIRKCTFTTAINPNLFSASLAYLLVERTTFHDDHIDFSICTHLAILIIQNCHLANITINPSCLEVLLLSIGSEVRQELPHMKVSFVGGSQFPNSLQKLCLEHVSMDGHIDLANCRKLQSLFINTTTSEGLTGICDVCNMQCCDALQELHLHTLIFPSDTHLDLSGLRHISKITIQNCHLTNITINPSYLKVLLLSIGSELMQELPHMKVSFVGGSQFSNSLQILCLKHVAMYVPLDLANCQELHELDIENTTSEGLTGIFDVCNMQCCSALQKLRLDTLIFPSDTHLDLSGLRHISKITIQNFHLDNINVNPSCLEKLWLYMRSELMQELPHMKVSFVGGSHFSNSLQILCLMHVSMDGHIDLANCRNLHKLIINNPTSEGLTGICDVSNMQCCSALQELCLTTLIFPADTHLDLSGLRHISQITIQNCHLANITINPSCLEFLWLYMRLEWRQELPHMKVSFIGGSQFPNSLQKLCLMHVAMDVPLDLVNCQELHTLIIDNTTSEGLAGIVYVCNMQCCSALQELCLTTLKFPADTHLDLSLLRHISQIIIQDCHLANITVNPSCLEVLWLYMRSEWRQELPHMKVSFVGGLQFPESLQELCLMHVSMDGHIDLANCRKLHKLIIHNTTSEGLTGLCDVYNMQCCDALQELRLETLKFPADTHLDLSGLRHISQIIIHDCHLANITINPSCLEILLLYIGSELMQELPHMKVSFVGGSQFPNSLQELCLMHMAMDVPLDLVNCQELNTLIIDNTTSEGLTGIFDVGNMQCCDALQELHLHTLIFPADTHLDLSLLRHISKITIQNCHLNNITINPSCLEKLWLYMRSERRQELPHMKVSFVGGSHFSNSLQILCLMHVSMDGHIDVANCRKLQSLYINNTTSERLTGICDVRNMHCCDALQELRLETLKLPSDTHLDLSGLRQISKITIQNCHLANITINPFCLEELSLSMRSELMQELPHMKVSFVGGSQFPNSLQKLCLMHVSMDGHIDLANCPKLQNLSIDNTTSEGFTGICDVRNMHCCSALKELPLYTLIFPADTHLDLSGLRHISQIRIQNCHLTNITINPSYLKVLLLSIGSELRQELPHMKVSFVGGSHFSNSLQILCLVHVSMDGHIDLANCPKLQSLYINNTTSERLTGICDVCNMHCCDALQELRLETLKLPSDTHLDLSGLRHISKITIQNCHLDNITVNPSQWSQTSFEISDNVHVAITPSTLG